MRSAIVGCGISGTQLHLPVIRQHPKLELGAICDTDEKRLKNIDTGQGVGEYTEVSQMLSDEDLGIVHICTPPQTHKTVAEECFKMGIPTLIEKPAAASSNDVTAMIDLSDETDTPASVIHNWLYMPFVQNAVERVEGGEIGEVVSTTMLFSNKQDLTSTDRGDWVFDLPGGELGEGLVHQVYLPLAFVDGLGEISGISKQNFANYSPPINFDGVSVSATDRSSNVLITIKVLSSAAPQALLYVNGTDGELCIDIKKKTSYVSKSDAPLFSPELSVKNKTNTIKSLASAISKNALRFSKEKVYPKINREPPKSSHYIQTDKFIESIKTGTEPPVTLKEARETILVLESIENSES